MSIAAAAPPLRRMRLVAAAVVLFGGLWMCLAAAPHARAEEAPPACAGKATGLGDPCGDKTGSAVDLGLDAEVDNDQETMQVVADATGKNKIAINFTWTLFAGFLVMFMQAGFALVETGFCRKKNATHVMMTNFMIYGIGILGFALTGYALMFGGYGPIAALGGSPPLDHGFSIAGWGLFGLKGFGLTKLYDVGILTHFLFNLVFMDTTATIVTGSMAERWKWNAFVVYGFVVSGLFYPIFGNWVWGGGWLAQLGSKGGLGHGVVDFAGSGVVHGVGGWLALAGAVVIGPRIGRFNKDGSANPMPGHNLPMALLGTFILAFGWFGFNAGSSLAATDLRISVVAVNTLLASATGAVAAMFWSMRHPKIKKPDPGMCVNGMLAGLVAITAPCAFVTTWAAMLIGAIAGVLVISSIYFFENRKIDDPVGAVSVHGVNGLWGLIALGLFADGSYGAGWNGVDGAVKGLFYGDAGQLIAQLIGCVTIIVWAGGGGWIFFKIQHAVQGIRSNAEDEMIGLDMPEMGAHSYLNADNGPDDEVSPAALASLKAHAND